jgi:hypothetical protein
MSSKPPSPQETEHRKKRERERGRKSIEKKKKKKDLRVYSNKMGSQYFERRKIFQLQKFFFI